MIAPVDGVVWVWSGFGDIWVFVGGLVPGGGWIADIGEMSGSFGVGIAGFVEEFLEDGDGFGGVVGGALGVSVGEVLVEILVEFEEGFEDACEESRGDLVEDGGVLEIAEEVWDAVVVCEIGECFGEFFEAWTFERHDWRLLRWPDGCVKESVYRSREIIEMWGNF